MSNAIDYARSHKSEKKIWFKSKFFKH